MTNSPKENESSPLREETLQLSNSFIDEDSALSQIEKGFNRGKWSKEEHEAFTQGVMIKGTDWINLSNAIPTRTSKQIKAHARKFLCQLQSAHRESDKEIIEAVNAFISQGDINKTSHPNEIKEEIVKNSIEPIEEKPTSCQLNDCYTKSIEKTDMKKAKFIISKEDKNKEEEQSSQLFNRNSEEEESQIEEEEEDANDDHDEKNIIDDLSVNVFDEQEKELSLKGTLGEANFESNVKKMEELKKISEVLLILTKTKNNEAQSANNGNRNSSQRQEQQKLRANLKSTRAAKVKAVNGLNGHNGNCSNVKDSSHCSSNESLPKFSNNKRGRDQKDFDEEDCCRNDDTKQTSPKPQARNTVDDNTRRNLTVNTNELLQLYKNMNKQTIPVLLASLKEPILDKNNEVRPQANDKCEEKTAEKLSQADIINKNLQQQQLTNKIPNMNMSYNTCSANINQLNQYYLPSNNINNAFIQSQLLPPSLQIQPQLQPLLQSSIPYQYPSVYSTQIQPQLSQLPPQLQFQLQSQMQLPQLPYLYPPELQLQQQQLLYGQLYPQYFPQFQQNNPLFPLSEPQSFSGSSFNPQLLSNAKQQGGESVNQSAPSYQNNPK